MFLQDQESISEPLGVIMFLPQDQPRSCPYTRLTFDEWQAPCLDIGAIRFGGGLGRTRRVRISGLSGQKGPSRAISVCAHDTYRECDCEARAQVPTEGPRSPNERQGSGRTASHALHLTCTAFPSSQW